MTLRGLLVPLSWGYGAAAAARRQWLEAHALALPRPVLSVGNITCGGTGKTPAVEMVARDLMARARRPAILSRGYGARWKDRDVEGNDELHVLRANLPSVPHFQGKDRHARGLDAIEAGADVLVLDDGFQHARLRRDLDLVLVDALAPFGGGHVLPAGLLREPLDALAKADLIAVTRCDQVEPRVLGVLETCLRDRFPRIPRLRIATCAVEWRSLAGDTHEPRALSAARAFAFCGIGNPESFRRQLGGLEVDLRGFLPFRDHHSYTVADVQRINARAKDAGADVVVMTQKDAVKIPCSPITAAWRFLRIQSRVTRGEEEYARALEGALGGGVRDASRAS